MVRPLCIYHPSVTSSFRFPEKLLIWPRKPLTIRLLCCDWKIFKVYCTLHDVHVNNLTDNRLNMTQRQHRRKEALPPLSMIMAATASRKSTQSYRIARNARFMPKNILFFTWVLTVFPNIQQQHHFLLPKIKMSECAQNVRMFTYLPSTLRVYMLWTFLHRTKQ